MNLIMFETPVLLELRGNIRKWQKYTKTSGPQRDLDKKAMSQYKSSLPFSNRGSKYKRKIALHRKSLSHIATDIGQAIRPKKATTYVAPVKTKSTVSTKRIISKDLDKPSYQRMSSLHVKKPLGSKADIHPSLRNSEYNLSRRGPQKDVSRVKKTRRQIKHLINKREETQEKSSPRLTVINNKEFDASNKVLNTDSSIKTSRKGYDDLRKKLQPVTSKPKKQDTTPSRRGLDVLRNKLQTSEPKKQDVGLTSKKGYDELRNKLGQKTTEPKKKDNSKYSILKKKGPKFNLSDYEL